ncbi:hypothetical protein PFMC_04200, partial [Plasmodium falciparum CAMP/Malaysia]
MFYTLGDYRDILYSGGNTSDSGNTNGSNNNNIVFEAGGTQEEKDKMKDIQEQLKKFFQNSGDKPSTSGNDPQTWWETNGQHIWNGMICALTYDTNSGGEGTPQVDDDVKKELWDTEKNKPKTKYQYNTVKLDDTSETQAKGGTSQHGQSTSPGTSGDNTPLSKFVLRPPYFRYLEEWGQNFCKERKKRLEEIKKECTQDNKPCSSYGENCKDQLSDDPSTDADLKCPGCGRECTKYKKWINTKKTEYEKQKNAYDGQKDKCEKESAGAAPNNDGNGFCKTLDTCTDAAKFLERLKNGPCKNDNVDDSGKDKTGNSHIKFDDKNKDKTFGPADNCKPCPEFKIDCQKGNCSKDKEEECKKEKKNSITANDIGDGGNSTVLEMRVSDDSKSGSGFDGLSDCKGAGIFTGIKENKWKCDKVCGYVVCKPEKGNGETTSGENNDQIITIRGLVEHWVHNFLEDYNRIRKKLKACRNNGEVSKCIKDCVGKWVEIKKEEWKNIKDHYQKQYGGNDSNNSFSVKTVLEQFEQRTEFQKAIKPCKSLDQFKTSCGLNSDKPSENGHKNAIDCMLQKLQKKIEECQSKHSGGTQPTCADEPPLEDEEEEYENENTVGKPAICKDVVDIKTENDETGETCTSEDTITKETVETDSTDGPKQEEERIAPSAGDDGATPGPQEPTQKSDDKIDQPDKEKETKDNKPPLPPKPLKPAKPKKNKKAKP